MQANLVVALSSEARPLIERYRMVRDRSVRAFGVYRSDPVRLIVTGMGKVNAAAGTAYLASLDASANRCWLNVGIAAHARLPVGTGLIASKITDRTAARTWYPPRVVDTAARGVHLTTFDHPVETCPPDTACDMEGSAYYSVAARFDPGELVQCYKIISDNGTGCSPELTRDAVETLVRGHVDPVASLVDSLRQLAGTLPPRAPGSKAAAEFDARWRFTTAQRAQLGELVRRMTALNATDMLHPGAWAHCGSARRLLAEMEHYLASLPPVLASTQE